MTIYMMCCKRQIIETEHIVVAGAEGGRGMNEKRNMRELFRNVLFLDSEVVT